MVGEAESQGEGSRETTGKARERARRLRAQAELAWARVQRAAQMGTGPSASVDSLLQAAAQTPPENYVAGIAASLLASAWLHAAGHRTASQNLSLIVTLILGAGLLVRAARRRQRVDA